VLAAASHGVFRLRGLLPYPLPPVRQPGTRTIAQDLHAAGSAHRRKLPANPAHHPARGLARSPRIVQIPSDRVTRGKSRMPGSQGGQGSGVGKVHGRGGRAIRHGGIFNIYQCCCDKFSYRNSNMAIETRSKPIAGDQQAGHPLPMPAVESEPSEMSVHAQSSGARNAVCLNKRPGQSKRSGLPQPLSPMRRGEIKHWTQRHDPRGVQHPMAFIVVPLMCRKSTVPAMPGRW
jgi:hypothetical protein